MKKLAIILSICIPVFLASCGGATDSGKEKETKKELTVKEKDYYEPGEYAAQRVLLAYVKKDVDLLKKYASGMMRMALDEEAMDRPDFKNQLKVWDGAIKEMRYSSDFINFQNVYYAYAHFCNDMEDPDKIYIVVLESRDQSEWVINVNPLRSIAKSTFEEKSAEIPELKEAYD